MERSRDKFTGHVGINRKMHCIRGKKEEERVFILDCPWQSIFRDLVHGNIHHKGSTLWMGLRPVQEVGVAGLRGGGGGGRGGRGQKWGPSPSEEACALAKTNLIPYTHVNLRRSEEHTSELQSR